MHRVGLQRTVLFLACVALTGVAWAKESVERTAFSFDEVQAEAVRLAELEGGPEQVLLVFDIDNTLLAMSQDLGSDQWFNWQRTLPPDDPRSVGDFDELLKVQSMLYAIGSMRPTEPIRQPAIVRQLQEDGFTTLLLTSRGYNLRDATRRELLANNYDFRESSLLVPDGLARPHDPYDVSQIEDSGISAAEAEAWLADSLNPGQLKEPRKVTCSEGVFMTAGQNKGVMLRMLLHKSGKVDKYKHIVFVDDNHSNTQDVLDAFEKQNVNLVAFRYAREDLNVRRFNENRHGEEDFAVLALMQIKKALETMNVSKANPPFTSTPLRLPNRQLQEASR